MNSENTSFVSQLSSSDNGSRSSEETRTPPAKRRNIVVLNQKPRLGKFKMNRCRQRCVSRVKIPLPSINHIDQLEIDQAQTFSDDDDGHLNFDIGDTIEQYNLLGFLGKGTFGRVAKARQIVSCQIVALKITRSIEECQESARNEILFLKRLRELDPEGKNLWVQMLDFFEFKGHVCIAFEKLGDSLYSFLKENNYQPYQLSQIRHIAYQLCYSVKALHDNMIIHTDLKPENICFVSSDFTYGIRSTRSQTYRKPIRTNIKLLDFGCAVDVFEDRDFMVQTRYYRAPEVLFGFQWAQAVDVWSIGCILFELYTGECLFAAEDDDEHYIVMQEVLGTLPDLYLSTKLAKKHASESSPYIKKRLHRKPLKKSMQVSSKEHQELFDLLEKMLNYNPEKRIPLSAALNHPFFLLLSDDLKLKH